jgi:hypothetical protein
MNSDLIAPKFFLELRGVLSSPITIRNKHKKTLLSKVFPGEVSDEKLMRAIEQMGSIVFRVSYKKNNIEAPMHFSAHIDNLKLAEKFILQYNTQKINNKILIQANLDYYQPNILENREFQYSRLLIELEDFQFINNYPF